jgi:hypothetical protein
MKLSWLVIAALGAAGVGCVSESVYTTDHLGIPVLLGPVRALRDPQANPGRPVVPVQTEIDQFFFFSSRDHKDHRGFVHTHTSVGWLHEGAGHFDAAFGEASQACPPCTPHVNQIDVGSWDIFLIGTFIEKNWAALDGSLNQ